MRPNFSSSSYGFVPAVVQDGKTGRVLTVGFMNRKAYKRTLKSGLVTLFSPKKNRLASEFEIDGEGGNLEVLSLRTDCTGESILISTRSNGPVCRKGKDTCFGERNERYGYLLELERFIRKRIAKPAKSSQTSRLIERGVAQISKKLGEEAVELVIEAINGGDELLKEEASDLLYHFMVMLAARDIPLDDVLDVLKKRRK